MNIINKETKTYNIPMKTFYEPKKEIQYHDSFLKDHNIIMSINNNDTKDFYDMPEENKVININKNELKSLRKLRKLRE